VESYRPTQNERKKVTMSNQPENENQQSQTVTPQELREFLLAELEASKQAIAELSDEQMEIITGGALHNEEAYEQGIIHDFHNTVSFTPSPSPQHTPTPSPQHAPVFVRSAPPSPTNPIVDGNRRRANLPSTLRRTNSAGAVPEIHAYLDRSGDFMRGRG
jgi:hypothetical protein